MMNTREARKSVEALQALRTMDTAEVLDLLRGGTPESDEVGPSSWERVETSALAACMILELLGLDKADYYAWFMSMPILEAYGQFREVAQLPGFASDRERDVMERMGSRYMEGAGS